MRQVGSDRCIGKEDQQESHGIVLHGGGTWLQVGCRRDSNGGEWAGTTVP